MERANTARVTTTRQRRLVQVETKGPFVKTCPPSSKDKTGTREGRQAWFQGRQGKLHPKVLSNKHRHKQRRQLSKPVVTLVQVTY